MEAKHTKGEWFAIQYANFFNIQSEPYYGESNLLDEDDHKEAEANARLMAAAPELLKTCLILRDIIANGKVKTLHFDKEIPEGETLVHYHVGSYFPVEEKDAFASLENLKKEVFSKVNEKE